MAMPAEARMAASERDMRMGSGFCPLRQGWQRVKRDMRMGLGYAGQGKDGSM